MQFWTVALLTLTAAACEDPACPSLLDETEIGDGKVVRPLDMSAEQAVLGWVEDDGLRVVHDEFDALEGSVPLNWTFERARAEGTAVHTEWTYACQYRRFAYREHRLEIPADVTLSSDDGLLSASGEVIVRFRHSVRDEPQEGVIGTLNVDHIDPAFRARLFDASPSLTDTGQDLVLSSDGADFFPAWLKVELFADGSTERLTGFVLKP